METVDRINEVYYGKIMSAEAYVASQEAGNYRIVGTSPFSSPVPLEELNSYERVYPDPEVTTTTTTVKIFEYLGSDES